MSEDHRVVVVETEDDVLVSFRNTQVLECLVSLPAVRPDDEGSVRLTFPEGSVHLGHKLVPLLVFISYRFVHKFIGYPVRAVFLQDVR